MTTLPALPSPRSSWVVLPSGAVLPAGRRRSYYQRVAPTERRCETCGTAFAAVGARRFCSGRCHPSRRAAGDADRARYEARRAAGLCVSCGRRKAEGVRCAVCAELVAARRKPRAQA